MPRNAISHSELRTREEEGRAEDGGVGGVRRLKVFNCLPFIFKRIRWDVYGNFLGQDAAEPRKKTSLAPPRPRRRILYKC